MTNQTNWRVYDGSDEQIAELESAKNGYLLRLDNGREVPSSQYFKHDLPIMQSRSTHYWLIPDDPLREMKVRWSMTGQPVFVRVYKKVWHDEYSVDEIYMTTTPDWNIPNAEYAFTEFKD